MTPSVSESMAAEIVAHMTDGVIAWGPDWRCTFVNERGAAILGRRSEELVGAIIDEALPEFTGEPFREAFRRAVVEGGPVEFEAITGSGQHWFENRVIPSSDGLLLFFSDITDRKRAEAALRNSEARLVRAQAVAGVGSWELDLASRTMWGSEEALRIYGLPVDHPFLPLEVVQPITLAEERPRLDAALTGLVRDDISYDVQFRIRRPSDGAIRVGRSRAEAVRDPQGRPLQIVGTIQDVTASVAADEERSSLVRAIEQADDIVMLEGTDRQITYVNPAFTRVYGFTVDEVIGRRPDFLNSDHHPASFWAERDAVVVAGETWTGTIVNRAKDGSIVEVNSTISPVRGDDGHVVGYVQVARDVTAQRALEARLVEAQRMESIGRLAGGIAHDFNNLLTAIRGYAGMILDGVPATDAELRDDVAQIINGADRAAALTRQLLAYSRRLVLEPVVVDPADVISGVVPLLRRLIGEHIDLRFRPAADDGRVRVDPGQLEQVIVNLVVNARDAMPNGGALTIELTRVGAERPEAAAGPGHAARRCIRISVADTGSGIDEAVLARIFEPFFTTKDPGKGTGMGLATVYGIVAQSGGTIAVESELGHGTAFRIDLPEVDEPATPVLQRPAPSPARGSGTILLVEDDDAVRGFIRRVLAQAGFVVIEASEPLAALTIAEAWTEPLDLLVTDVLMPGISGNELATRLAAARPELRILLTSGFTEGSEVFSGLPPERFVFLPKPYSAERLMDAVHEALGTPDDAAGRGGMAPGNPGAAGTRIDVP